MSEEMRWDGMHKEKKKGGEEEAKRNAYFETA